MTPKGVMVHSTGCNNPDIRRYVQPLPSYSNYDELMALFGKCDYNNHWNMPGLDVCVHGFIGKLADGSIATAQTLPWNMRGWHCASGWAGSGNNTHISFEICEDGLQDAEYFNKVYWEAVELTAMLCEKYNLDPLADGVVICHSEGYYRGIASGHADVMHWFPKHGKTMDDFRHDVAEEMGENMTGEEIYKRLMEYLRSQPTSEYAMSASVKGVKSGYFADGDGDLLIDDPQAFLKRQEFATVLDRMGLLGK